MKYIGLLIMTALLASCGQGKKNPVGDDLKTIREEGKTITEMGPQKVKVIEKTVVVKEPQPVYIEQSKIDGSFLYINPDDGMVFSEGQKSSYTIRAHVSIPGVQAKLVASGLPAGATLEAGSSQKNTPAKKDSATPENANANKDVYTLTWTPDYQTVPSTEGHKKITVKLSFQATSVADKQAEEKLKGLVKEKEITLVVVPNGTAPSELKISGLPQEVAEGQDPVPFKVTAKVPGYDNKTAEKPYIVFRYDNVSHTAGNNFLELDGSRHVIIDERQKEARYLGNSVWEFSLMFDAKNIAVQPQLARDGSLLQGADGTRVRMIFKVYNARGLSTPSTVAQTKINYDKKFATPRFDLSGLGKASLEVSPGETIRLKFVVGSVDPKNQVTVTAQPTNLPGGPTVTCQNSPQGSHKQNCTLQWKVPCDATAQNIEGEISMSATGSTSEQATQHTLKTKAANPEKKLCQKQGKK